MRLGTALAETSGVEESWGLHRGDDIDETLVVIDALGGGTRYEVYRAWDRTLFCEVAVKALRPSRLPDHYALGGFEREVAIARRLLHPNLVRYLRWRPGPPRPYFVMEFIRAQTLEDHLNEHDDVSVPEICLLGVRMCSALHYLHSQSVIHLDVKPENLTMGDEGLTCMRPYSAGVEESTVPAERYPQLVEEPEPLRARFPELPRSLDQAIMACLERDPAKRPASAIEIAIALEGVLEEFHIDELLAWPRALPVRPRASLTPVATF